MNRVFADSFYFFAVFNLRDARHADAVAMSRKLARGIVTTEWVMVEVADGLASSPGRATFRRWRQAFLEVPGNILRLFDDALYQDGLNFYAARPDKAWSLTDCISFFVMQREGLSEALTGDHHFEQAGFRALFI